MTQTNIYTDTLLDSGKNFLIHIIDEVSTAITVNLQRHLHHYHEKNNAQRQFITENIAWLVETKDEVHLDDSQGSLEERLKFQKKIWSPSSR